MNNRRFTPDPRAIWEASCTVRQFEQLKGSFIIFRAFMTLLMCAMLTMWVESRIEIHQLKEQLEHTVPVIDCHVIDCCPVPPEVQDSTYSDVVIPIEIEKVE